MYNTLKGTWDWAGNGSCLPKSVLSFSTMQSCSWKCDCSAGAGPTLPGSQGWPSDGISPGECQNYCVSLPGLGLTSFLHGFVFSLSRWLKPRRGEDRASTTQGMMNGRRLIPRVMGEGNFFVLEPSVLMDLLVKTV